MNRMRWFLLCLTTAALLVAAACSADTKQKGRTATVPNNSAVNNDVATARAFDHNTFDNLLMTYVNDDGWVDYFGLQRDRAKLNDYLTALASATPQSFPSDTERLAFWINAYNAFTLADVLDDVYQNVSGVDKVVGFFDKKKHKVAREELTLDQIENRGRDLKDPRIHFAAVGASTSAPKLQRFAYTGAMLEEQLTRIARGFLSDRERGLRVVADRKQIRLSSIFKWYAGDFPMSSASPSRVKAVVARTQILEYVKKYAPEESVKFINEKKPGALYIDYDWSLNAQETHVNRHASADGEDE